MVERKTLVRLLSAFGAGTCGIKRACQISVAPLYYRGSQTTGMLKRLACHEEDRSAIRNRSARARDGNLEHGRGRAPALARACGAAARNRSRHDLDRYRGN